MNLQEIFCTQTLMFVMFVYVMYRCKNLNFLRKMEGCDSGSRNGPLKHPMCSLMK